MKSWEVLERAIPRKASERVAQILRITPDYVRRWRREPDDPNDISSTGSGQRSILDRILDLIDAVFLVNPSGVPLIVNHVNAHHRELVQTHAIPLETIETRVQVTAKLLTEATQAINSMNLEGCTDDTHQQLVELKAAVDEAIQHCESTMKEVPNA